MLCRPVFIRNLSDLFRKTMSLHKPSKCPHPSNALGHAAMSCSNDSDCTEPSCKVYKNSTFRVLTEPVKSASDKKEYKVIQLANGLTACLVADSSPIDTAEELEQNDEESDSEVDSSKASVCESDDGSEDEPENKCDQKMAAAALCVGVGSFSDPKDVQGMAHFLEHMVFMGSEKFPEENDFDAFIKKGGGSANAATDTESTCFYFECLEKNLFEALDKFSQFFIAPLMEKEAMTREREAIESEFQVALNSDSSRKEQLLCSLTKDGSPVNMFSWGNLITLRDNVDDDELYRGVHEFRLKHYSAHRMKLAIQARLPMATLEDYVVQCFKDVPRFDFPADDFSEYLKEGITSSAFNKLYYVKAIKDLNNLNITWILPSLLNKYKGKPNHYLSSLLGDEGKGSLLSYLRKKVWGLTTCVGTGDTGSDSNSIYTLFTVSIVLTEEGKTHVFEVIEAVFSYLNLLRKLGPQKRYFDELMQIADASFQFPTEETAVDWVETLADNMHLYSPEHYITGSELFFEYNPEDIHAILDALQPDSMNIMILSRTPPEGLAFTKKEQWFGTEFIEQDFPEELLKKWRTVEPYLELAIPPENKYLTTDFSILPSVEGAAEYPRKIVDSPLYELWYKQDNKFKLPMAHYQFYLVSPKACNSPQGLAMLDIFVNLYLITLTEDLYPAASAHLSYAAEASERGLVIKVNGYNQKLPILIDVMNKYLVEFFEFTTKDMFDAIKDKVSKNYYNTLLKPGTLAKEYRIKILVENTFTSSEKLQEISNITFDTFEKFVKDYLKVLKVKVLVQGNVCEQEATKTTEKFINGLKFEALLPSAYPQFPVVQLPNGEHCCRIQALNPNDSNSIVTNYYQDGVLTLRSSVIAELVMMIIEEPCFDILRTKEQLGYHVYNTVRDTFGILGFTISVNTQATKHSTQKVEERIEAFVKKMTHVLYRMTEEEFEQTKSSLIKMKQCLDVNLKEEVDRNWEEIVCGEYLFNRLEKERQLLVEITDEEIIEWWTKHTYKKKEGFRQLSIQIVGYNIKCETKEPPTTDCNTEVLFIGNEETAQQENKHDNYFLRSVSDFKRNLNVFPVVRKF